MTATVQQSSNVETLRQRLIAVEGEYRQAQQMFEDYLRFERLLTNISRFFVNVPAEKIDHAIQQSLQQVVECLNIDRTSFIEFSVDQSQFQITYTYVVPGLPEVTERVMDSAQFPWSLERLRRGDIVQIVDMDDLPGEAEMDKQEFQNLGIRSIVILPVTMDERVLCALTVAMLREKRCWKETFVSRLRLVSEIFANGNVRKRAWQQQEEYNRIERLIVDLSAEFIKMLPHKVDTNIYEGLKRLVEALPGVDRSSFAAFSPDQTQLIATHSSAVPDFKPYPLGRINEAIPWAMGELLRGETVRVTGPDDIPEEARSDLETFLKWGLQASSLIPITIGGSVRFIITMGSLRSKKLCSEEVIGHLQIIGEIFGNTLIRRDHEESLRSAFAELKQLRDRLQVENLYLQEEVQLKSSHGKIIGESHAIQVVLRQIKQVAETDSSVLIQGETGTGKELIAQTIHQLSSRKQRSMIIVNCAALPPTLIESALFGHEKGAFTGALRKKAGYFEIADGSTMFLDEIGELPLELQAKLLRVLEEGQFERLGSTQTLTVDVRVIAATNQHLSSAVAKGDFRDDLYYRLNVFPIHVPPLRERPQDIPLLVWAFVRSFTKSMNKPIEKIPRNAMRALQRYPWPGNVRELRNVIEHAMIISQGSTLTLPPLEMETPEESFSPEWSLDEVMKQHILTVLERSGWRIRGKQGAADILGVKATTLEARMKKLGITRPA